MEKVWFELILWRYLILDRIKEDKWSIIKIVIKIIIIIAETFWYSNILNEDCSSYPMPPAPTIPSIVAILIFRSKIYKLFAIKDGMIWGIMAKEIICLLDAPEDFSASMGPLLTCSISSA